MNRGLLLPLVLLLAGAGGVQDPPPLIPGQDNPVPAGWPKLPAGWWNDGPGLRGIWDVSVEVGGRARKAICHVSACSQTGFTPAFRGYEKTGDVLDTFFFAAGADKTPATLKGDRAVIPHDYYSSSSMSLTWSDWNTMTGTWKVTKCKPEDEKAIPKDRDHPVVWRRWTPTIHSITPALIGPETRTGVGTVGSFLDTKIPASVEVTVRGWNLTPDLGLLSEPYPYPILVEGGGLRVSTSSSISCSRQEIRFQLEIPVEAKPAPLTFRILGRRFENAARFSRTRKEHCEAVAREVLKARHRLAECRETVEQLGPARVFLFAKKLEWIPPTAQDPNPIEPAAGLAKALKDLPWSRRVTSTAETLHKALQTWIDAQPVAEQKLSRYREGLDSTAKELESFEAAQVNGDVEEIRQLLRQLELWKDRDIFRDAPPAVAAGLPDPPPAAASLDPIGLPPEHRSAIDALPVVLTYDADLDATVGLSAKGDALTWHQPPSPDLWARLDRLKKAFEKKSKGSATFAEHVQAVELLEAALEEQGIRSRYATFAASLRREGHEGYLRLARDMVRMTGRALDLLDSLDARAGQALEEAGRVHAELEDEFIRCLLEVGELAQLRKELEELHGTRIPALLREMDERGEAERRDLEAWWASFDAELAAASEACVELAKDLLHVEDMADRMSTPMIDSMIEAADKVSLALAVYQIARLLKGGAVLGAKALRKLWDLGKAGVGLLKDGVRLARLRAARPELLKSAGEIFGKGPEAAAKSRKLIDHLAGAGLTADQVRTALAQAKDPAKTLEVLKNLGGTLHDLQAKYGDFLMKSVGTGSHVDEILRLGKNATPEDVKRISDKWKLLKNDYDVSVYLPKTTVDRIVDGLHQEGKLGEYLGRLGFRPDADLKSFVNPDRVREMLAESKLVDDLKAGFKRKNGGLGVEAYDNMWFSGFPTKTSREEFVAGLFQKLPPRPPAPGVGGKTVSFPDEIDGLLRQGNMDEARRRMKAAYPDQAKAVDDVLAQAAGAPSIQQVMAGKASAWKLVDLTGDGPFVTNGGKTLVEMMQDLSGQPFTFVGKTGLGKVDDAAAAGHAYAASAYKFDVAKGADILTEMSAFFHQNAAAGKTADKVAKYFVRSALGRMATDPKLAEQIPGLLKGLKGDPETRIVELARQLRAGDNPAWKNLFRDQEFALLEDALKMKSGKLKPEAAESATFRNRMSDMMSDWYRDGMTRFRDAPIPDYQRRMHEMGQKVTMGRLDKDLIAGRMNPFTDPAQAARWREEAERIAKLKDQSNLKPVLKHGDEPTAEMRKEKLRDAWAASTLAKEAGRGDESGDLESWVKQGADVPPPPGLETHGPGLLDLLGETFSDPNKDITREVSEFHRSSGMTGVLVWSVWKAALDPIKMSPRSFRYLVRYWYLDQKRHAELAGRLDARIAFLAERLDPARGRGFWHPARFAPDLGDPSVLPRLIDRESQLFRDRLEARLKTEKDPQRAAIVKELLSKHEAYVTTEVAWRIATFEEWTLPKLHAGAEAARKAARSVQQRQGDFRKLHHAATQVRRNIAAHLEVHEYEQLIKRSRLAVLVPAAGIRQYLETVRADLKAASGQ